jgi:methanogenic corrinoid protein MtbC1
MEARHSTQCDTPAETDERPPSNGARGPAQPVLPRAEYAIAAVSKLTGISCHTLRVWERRYGFPIPSRSASGHRRYDRAQVQVLCRLIRLNRSKRRPIGELIAGLRAGEIDLGPAPSTYAELTGDESISELVARLVSGDSGGADREYARLAGRLDARGLVDRVIYPAMIEVGEGWFRKNYHVFQERLASVFLRRKLAELIEAARKSNIQPTHTVVAGTVQGDRHEGGVLIFQHAMELRGWRVYNLGVDLPVCEYGEAIRSLHPSALALSFILSRNVKKRFQELETLRMLPIFVGGRSMVNYQSLARSHGLIPLSGPIAITADQLVLEYDLWRRKHDTGVTPSSR